MKANLFSTWIHWFTWGWVFVMAVHTFLNLAIFRRIGKEEVELRVWGDRRWRGTLLSFFTFRWSKDYMEDNDPITTRMMKISNVLSIFFILYTIAAFAIWIITY